MGWCLGEVREFFFSWGGVTKAIGQRDSKGKKPGTKGVLQSYFRSTDSFLQFCFDVKVGYGSPKLQLYVRHIAIPLKSGKACCFRRLSGIWDIVFLQWSEKHSGQPFLRVS